MSQRLFIISHARSGSTWLTETIGSHSDVFLYNEPLNPSCDAYPVIIRILNTKFRNLSLIRKFIENKCYQRLKDIETKLKARKERWAGYKILAGQLVKFPDEKKYFFSKYSNDKIILLQRENIVASAISLIVAEQNNSWHLRKPTNLNKSTIDPEHLLQVIHRLQTNIEKVLDEIRSSEFKHLNITYKELFTDIPSTLQRIAKFLDIPPKFTYSTIRKSIDLPIENHVENVAEISDYLSSFPDYWRMFQKLKCSDNVSNIKYSQ